MLNIYTYLINKKGSPFLDAEICIHYHTISDSKILKYINNKAIYKEMES